MEMFTWMEHKKLECLFLLVQDSSCCAHPDNYLLTLSLLKLFRQLVTLQRAFALVLFVGRLLKKKKETADKHVLRVWYFEYVNDGAYFFFNKKKRREESATAQHFDNRNE
jgi:hypothetical protein